MSAARRPRGRDPAAVAGRLRAHHSCARHSEALPPRSALAVVVEDRFRAVFEGNPDIDAILPPRPARCAAGGRLCLNLHGGTRSAWMTALPAPASARDSATSAIDSSITSCIPRAQEILGVERKVTPPNIWRAPCFISGAARARSRAPSCFAEPRPSGERPHAVIHPVASTPDKTWPAEGFLAVAGHLQQPRPRAGLHRRRRATISRPSARSAPSPGAPLAEIKSSAGRRHRSSSATIPARPTWRPPSACPVVVIFGASDPAIWGPWRTASEVVTSPAGHRRGVEVAQVLDALARLRVPA